MDQLPIDIHLTKLLGKINDMKLNHQLLCNRNVFNFVDWLLNRRNCPRDWQKNVNPIRTKINLAIQDMPENDEITSLLSGSSKLFSHYFSDYLGFNIC